jgi:hypothetical protein
MEDNKRSSKAAASPDFDDGGLDIEIMGGSQCDLNDRTMQRIKAALDALEGPARFKVFTNKNLHELCAVSGSYTSHRHGERMAALGYAYQTQTTRKTRRPNTWLWGHPDAIKIAKQKGY